MSHLNHRILSQCWIAMERLPNYRTATILISNRKLQKLQFKVILVYSLSSLFIDTKVLLLCSQMIRGTRTCKRKKKKWKRMSVPLSWKHTVISSSASLCRAMKPNLLQFRERQGCTMPRKSRKKRLKTQKGRALVMSSARIVWTQTRRRLALSLFPNQKREWQSKRHKWLISTVITLELLRNVSLFTRSKCILIHMMYLALRRELGIKSEA